MKELFRLLPNEVIFDVFCFFNLNNLLWQNNSCRLFNILASKLVLKIRPARYVPPIIVDRLGIHLRQKTDVGWSLHRVPIPEVGGVLKRQKGHKRQFGRASKDTESKNQCQNKRTIRWGI